MTKRKTEEVSEDRDDRKQGHLTSTFKVNNSAGGCSIRGDDNDEEEEKHGIPFRSVRSRKSDNRDAENISEGGESYSAEESHLKSVIVHESRRLESGQRKQTRGEPPTAFGRAFGKIMNKRMTQLDLVEMTGPMLTERKSLLLQKLDRKDAEMEAKTSNKEDTREIREKGHVLPPSYTDFKERALVRTATKGVVRLFNAISKAQKIQSGSDFVSERSVNAVLKQTKATFLTELRKAYTEPKTGRQDVQPDWLALKPNFMLEKSHKDVVGWDRSFVNVNFTGDI